MELLAISLIPFLNTLLNLLIVVVGLGLVIFFHELGHFAVAKWCNVNVERFSIGFGPILWCFKRGETEYALSAIPFGGYVKMLGQDDADPSRTTDDEITADPRSYPAKSVLQRMAIISAGVIMNLITGMLFFALAFQQGIQVPDRVIGAVQTGMPAWEYGIRAGDTITEINGKAIENYNDIRIQTALSTGAMTIRGFRVDGSTFDVRLTPDRRGSFRRVGILPQESLELVYVSNHPQYPVALPGTAASTLVDQLQRGDQVLAVDGIELTGMSQFADYLAEHRHESVELTLRPRDRRAETKTVILPPQAFRSLGITFSNGRIAAISRDSPASQADTEGDTIKLGDRIIRVDGLTVGGDIDPLQLPDFFGERAGQEVRVLLSREQTAGPPREIEVTLQPEHRVGWTEQPIFDQTPLSIPSIGVAVEVLPTILAVEPGGPAARAGLQPRETITQITLTRPESVPSSEYLPDKVTLVIGERSLPHAFWKLQELPAWEVTLHVKSSGSDAVREVPIVPVAAEGWFLPTTRGLQFNPSMTDRKSDTLLGAIGMGMSYTRDSVQQIYLTLRSLVTGDLSIKGLSGPIGIAKIAWQFANHGFADFLLFLGLISVNLAVINFLPIPVLDGGHMVFLTWEGLTGKKPNETVFRWATNLGLLFILGLLVTVIYLDLFVSKD